MTLPKKEEAKLCSLQEKINSNRDFRIHVREQVKLLESKKKVDLKNLDEIVTAEEYFLRIQFEIMQDCKQRASTPEVGIFFIAEQCEEHPEEAKKMFTTSYSFPLARKQLIVYAAFSFAVALINLFEIAPLYIPHSKGSSTQKKLRLMHFNVYTTTTRW